jgi:hypothetical protein
LLAATYCAVGRGATFAQAGSAAQFDIEAAQEIVDLVNQERASRGLQPLAVDQRLTQAARQHTLLMAQHEALSHQFDGEPGLQQRFGDQNLRSNKQGENLGYDLSAASAHASLMHSPPHRANILGEDYNVIGVSVLRKGDHIYVTEDFARRTPDYSEREADAAVQVALEKFATSHRMPLPTRKALPQLHQLACQMALNDSLDPAPAGHFPRVTSAAVWNTGDLSNLPRNVQGLLSQPLNAGYSLGLCYAPSVSQPGGVYWLVMVTY